ncbi:dnaJ homolog subfamily C member 15 isoform X2 [Candoia aspera]|uniref:dnaJ homolog subfamily C member 15 isoform X2 n=1 Tax=Candoia aspera TaxID=51853 RepID=UPI002FD7C83E
MVERPGSSSESLRYAEYIARSGGGGQGPDINQGLARSVIGVGLGIAAIAFGGRYAFQLWKPLEQIITEAVRKISPTTLSSYYRGGFEPKMNVREASLILGIRWFTILGNKNQRSKGSVGIKQETLEPFTACQKF